MLISFKRKFVDTPGGRKYFLELDSKDRESILRKTKKEWKVLIDLHFDAEAGITVSGKRRWKKLSEKYVKFKEREDLLPGILEASTPTLKERYKDSISYNTKDFTITINFPYLVTGPSRLSSGYANAGVHQLGHIKRPLLKKSFTEVFKNKIREHFTK